MENRRVGRDQPLRFTGDEIGVDAPAILGVHEDDANTLALELTAVCPCCGSPVPLPPWAYTRLEEELTVMWLEPAVTVLQECINPCEACASGQCPVNDPECMEEP